MVDIKRVFKRVPVEMGNFPSKFRGTGGFGFCLTGNIGAGSKILPREGLYLIGHGNKVFRKCAKRCLIRYAKTDTGFALGVAYPESSSIRIGHSL